jgi:hypothetical protein
MYIWPILYNREFTFEPNFLKYRTLNQTWRIDAVEIAEHDKDTLTLTKSMQVPVEPGHPTTHIKIAYQDVTTGGKHQLKLKTFGEFGNFHFKVRLEFRVSIHDPIVVFREEDVFVFGQSIQGDEAYYKYLSCMENVERACKKFVPVHRFIRPDS